MTSHSLECISFFVRAAAGTSRALYWTSSFASTTTCVNLRKDQHSASVLLESHTNVLGSFHVIGVLEADTSPTINRDSFTIMAMRGA
jgi:hypothetical protein